MNLHFYSFKVQWSLYVPPILIFSNSIFCPHSVFMCFEWIWGPRAIISLYINNRMVFITETESVYCAVRARPWKKSFSSSKRWGALPKFLTATAAFSCNPLFFLFYHRPLAVKEKPIKHNFQITLFRLTEVLKFRDPYFKLLSRL